MKKKIIVASAVLVSLSSVASAQFFSFGPQITFDPIVAAKIILEIEKLYEIFVKLEQIRSLASRTADQLESSAKAIAHKETWLYATRPWLSPVSSNEYGTSGGWIDTLNTGLGAAQSYDMAAIRMASPAALLASMSPANQNRWASEQATAELNRGMAIHAMSVTGSERAMAESHQRALNTLANDALSDDQSKNTEAGLLNMINQGNIINAQGVQSGNQMLATIVDQNTIALKQRQDAMSEAVNASVAAQAAAAENTRSIWGDRGQQIRMRLGGN